MRTYRLTKIFEVPYTIRFRSNENGKIKPKQMTLEPGKTYMIPDGDNVMEMSLAKDTKKASYTPELKAKLDALEIPYELKSTCSCGSGKKKLIYHTVEVNDAE